MITGKISSQSYTKNAQLMFHPKISILSTKFWGGTAKFRVYFQHYPKILNICHTFFLRRTLLQCIQWAHFLYYSYYDYNELPTISKQTETKIRNLLYFCFYRAIVGLNFKQLEKAQYFFILFLCGCPLLT